MFCPSWLPVFWPYYMISRRPGQLFRQFAALKNARYNRPVSFCPQKPPEKAPDSRIPGNTGRIRRIDTIRFTGYNNVRQTAITV